MSTSVNNGVEEISDLQIEEGDVTEDEQPEPPDASLFIPSDIVNNLNSSTARLVVTAYREDSLFQSRNLTLSNQGDADYDVDVNSAILSVSFGDFVLENLDEPVKLIFLTKNPVCSYVYYKTFNSYIGCVEWRIIKINYPRSPPPKKNNEKQTNTGTAYFPQ